MLFSSLTFLCIFLPVVVCVYYLLSPVLRNCFLLAASLFFYAWGEPKYILVMLWVILINYVAGLLLEYSLRWRRCILVVSLILDIGCLTYFKYTDFLIVNFNALTGGSIALMNIALPIGISFYIFQSMSYTIDVYRKIVGAQHSLVKFALYVALFPQLVAGPIVRYKDIETQLFQRNTSVERLSDGLRRFIIGLSKKVLLANTMGEVADKVFAAGPDNIACTIAWLGAIAYALQIYFDFSGYSDMAIGLGKVFGFDFKENFNYPYTAVSMTDFWRRWHISLGAWFKEYLYIPLGGNRVSVVRRNLNLLIVFLATGLWHGASWNFVIWGLWHGFFLVSEKYYNFEICKNSVIKKCMQHIYVVLVFVLGYVFFRSDSLSVAINYLQIMLGMHTNTTMNFGWEYYLTRKTLLFGMVAIVAACKWNYKYFVSQNVMLCFVIRDLILLILLVACVVSIAASGYNPFIYFRF